jgi:hypothetical protein
VEEQSHKQEMSAAVRADFARLRARGVVTTIAAEKGHSASPASAGSGHEHAPDRPEAGGRRRRFRPWRRR